MPVGGEQNLDALEGLRPCLSPDEEGCPLFDDEFEPEVRVDEVDE